MAIKAIPTDSIDRLVSTANSGDLNTAVAVLQQSGLNEEQKAKITSILKEPRSDMRERIVAVFEENIAAASAEQAASSQATPPEQACISFSDASAAPFGNAYPCKFEFGGKHYQSAKACFLAQQYTDQPKLMDLFTTRNPEEATALAELAPMTKERKISWKNPHAEHINKDDVLMHVLRAKFGQNPELKNQLLATDGDYLLCQGYELYLSDNMNGTGKNALGTSLMRLRGEYRGTGQVAAPAAYHSAMQSLQTRCHSIAIEMPSDIIGLLFNSYFSQCDFKTVTAVACVNKQWNYCSANFWARCDLKQLCPELTILDAEAQGVNCEDEPKISKRQLLKWVREISPKVEGNAGVTQLTISKGTTLNQLIEIAKGEGMTVEFMFDVEEIGDVPVEQTYTILITNNVFMHSRNKDCQSQTILVLRQGCEKPTVQEYIALCVFTNKVFKKCLYGQNPPTYGRTSTVIGDGPLVVGNSDGTYLIVDIGSHDFTHTGAGGKKKF